MFTLDLDKFKDSIINASYNSITLGLGVNFGTSIPTKPSANAYDDFNTLYLLDLKKTLNQLKRFAVFNDSGVIEVVRNIYACRCELNVDVILSAYMEVVPTLFITTFGTDKDFRKDLSFVYILQKLIYEHKLNNVYDFINKPDVIVKDYLEEILFQYKKENLMLQISESDFYAALGMLRNIVRWVIDGNVEHFNDTSDRLVYKTIVHCLYGKFYLPSDSGVEVDDVIKNLLPL